MTEDSHGNKGFWYNPPMAVTRVLQKALIPDNFTRSLFRISPYRGCSHGCRYCDGRAERYYVPGDFEKDVEVRENIPSRLEEELLNFREWGMVTLGSGVTDVYQPKEAEAGLTRKILTLLAKSELPVQILTKSDLVQRDLDILGPLAKKVGAVLLISLTTLDQDLLNVMEPGASRASERIETLRLAKAAGLTTGVLAMPLLPGLSDDKKSVENLANALKSVEVDFVCPGGLTLRPGCQKEIYLDTLAAHHPELLTFYKEIYGENRPSGMPQRHPSYQGDYLIQILRDMGIPPVMPQRIYKNLLPRGDGLSLVFQDLRDHYKYRGIDVRSLQSIISRYNSWWIDLRKHFRRHRALEDTWLDQRFTEALTFGELERLLDNKKLWKFTQEILDGGEWNSLGPGTPRQGFPKTV